MSWALRVLVPFLLAACVVRSARIQEAASNYPAALSNMHRSVKGIVKRTQSSEEQAKLDALNAIMNALDNLNEGQSQLVADYRESKCEPECHKWIKGQEQLKTVLESFNSVVQTFVSIKEISPQAYAELEPGTHEIEGNLMGALKTACDPVMVLEKADTAEFNANCQDGLWPALSLEKSSFPQPGYQVWTPVLEQVACRSRTFAKSQPDYEIESGATMEECAAKCGDGCVGISLRNNIHEGRCYVHDSCPGGPIPKGEGRNYNTYLKSFWDVTKGTACKSTTFDKSAPDYEIQNGATIEECAAKCGDGCVGISLRSHNGQEGRCYIHDKCPGGPTNKIGQGTNYDTYMKPQ